MGCSGAGGKDDRAHSPSGPTGPRNKAEMKSTRLTAATRSPTRAKLRVEMPRASGHSLLLVVALLAIVAAGSSRAGMTARGTRPSTPVSPDHASIGEYRRSPADGTTLVVDQQSRIHVHGQVIGIGASLTSAIRALGHPKLAGDTESGNLDCFAKWSRIGINALFQDFGGTGPYGLCRPGHAFRLGFATLRGDWWQTNRGLSVGDTAQTVQRLYPHAPATICNTDQVKTHGFALATRPDDSAGGIRVSTLCAIVSADRVVGLGISRTGE